MPSSSTLTHHFHPWAIQGQANPLDISKADGVFFWDSQGRRFLDFISQIFNVNLGHGNQRIIEAIQDQAGKLTTASPSLMHEGRIQLAERLAAVTPSGLDKAFFTNSGSEANEIAFSLARMFTGRHKILAKYRSYHGATLGTLGLAGDPRRAPIDVLSPGAVRFFGPYCYRCDFNLKYPSCELHCADALEQQILMESPETIAAIVLEPFTAAAGGYNVPPGYLQRVREICDRNGILMIADEVITGFGRTGEWFAVNHEGVVPDIMTVAKGLTSGYVPMGAAIVNQTISDHFDEHSLPLGCTYGNHPLACAAALATLDEYREKGAIENCRAQGHLLSEELARLKDRHACVGDVRSQGLFACIELVRDQSTRERLIPFNTSNELEANLKRRCLDEGLHLFVRWNLLMLSPPLIIKEDELLDGLQHLDAVLTWVDQQLANGH